MDRQVFMYSIRLKLAVVILLVIPFSGKLCFSSRLVAQEKNAWNRNESSPEKLKVGKNFASSELIAWCIVPFDAKNRGPEQRAKMVRELGLRRIAYDWRDIHIPEFEAEILAYKKHGIEYFAFWNWHDSMEPLIKKHGIRPQIWDMFRGKLKAKTDPERLKEVVGQFLPKATKANELGLRFGIYNHGGWAGRPGNLILVCKELRQTHGLKNVGIVYNFHHAHEDLPELKRTVSKLLPFLMCVNMNGMAPLKVYKQDIKGKKILPIGAGENEKAMIQWFNEAGYDGPIGVLGHRKEMDAKEAVQLNLQGLGEMVTIDAK